MICTPAERDLIVAGATQLVAPGDHKTWPGTGRMRAGGMTITHEHVAPQRWVNATGPCPTCDGQRAGVVDGCAACFDCIDGRKREALQVEAPKQTDDALVATFTEFLTHAGPPDGGAGRRLAAAGRGDLADWALGLVTFAYATVEVLPVVQFTGKQETPSGRYVLLGSQPDDPTVLIPNEVVIPLNPLPVPGRDWVVLLDNVELT